VGIREGKETQGNANANANANALEKKREKRGGRNTDDSKPTNRKKGTNLEVNDAVTPSPEDLASAECRV
jgi:hypothetical protein